MFRGLKYGILFLAAAAFVAGCQDKTIIPEDQPQPGEKVYTGCIPEKTDHLPRLNLQLPQDWELDDIRKEVWTDGCSVSIQASVNGQESTVFTAQGVKVKGRGNSTYKSYPKKPLTLHFFNQVNFIGTGKTKHWVLLANWMDRTLLRNDVAFEAARRTSLEWTPSGTFVDLYVNGKYEGVYWLGEKIHVEGSHFTCDYLYSYDTSDKQECDFYSLHGHWKQDQAVGEIPVELKYPDRDNYSTEEFHTILNKAKNTLHGFEEALFRGEDPASLLDMNSLCDWYLVEELCGNKEPRFPKSTFLYYKEGKIYSGPVWDFDYGTFNPDHHGLQLQGCMYFYQLWSHPTFRKHLKHRWSILKPQFQDLLSYVDQRADFIRESEERNHQMWPCYPNPLSEDGTGLVNRDEKMTFDEAVARLKQALLDRIAEMDLEINIL